jgi:hypothetical protein
MRDEYGDVNVYSEERYKALKAKANEGYSVLCEVIKKSETSLLGIVEFLRCAEKNEKMFYTKSKEYVEILKKLEDENTKTKF